MWKKYYTGKREEDEEKQPIRYRLEVEIDSAGNKTFRDIALWKPFPE